MFFRLFQSSFLHNKYEWGDSVQQQMLNKRAVSILIIILLCTFAVCFFTEKSSSYLEPQEAINAVEQDLLLIPAYIKNDDALYFFIKDMNNLGVTYVQRGIVGWKAGILTWSSIDSNRNYDKFTGYKSQGEGLIYGLIKYEEDRIVKMNENEAKYLKLDVMLPQKVVEEYKLEDLCIWYFENATVSEEKTIELISNTGKVIDFINL